jgi:acetone carboxylase gamma subunit
MGKVLSNMPLTILKNYDTFLMQLFKLNMKSANALTYSEICLLPQGARLFVINPHGEEEYYKKQGPSHTVCEYYKNIPELLNAEVTKNGVHSCLRIYDDTLEVHEYSVFLDQMQNIEKIYSYS